jgi:hypothetical protein
MKITLERMKEEVRKDCPDVLVKTAANLAQSGAEMVEDTLGKIGDLLEKLNQFIANFKDVLPTISSLGFSIELVNIHIRMLPEAEIRILGRVQDIDETKVMDLVKAESQNSMLVPILHALRSVALLKEPLQKVGFQGIRVDIHIVAAIPSIDIEFLR